VIRIMGRQVRIRPLLCSFLLFTALYTLVPSALERISALAADTRTALQRVRSLSPAERKLAAYGDRTRFGYGYVKDILEGIPDKEVAPATRYSDYGRHPEILLSALRNRLDNRLLIGIDLSDQDLAESLIASTKQPCGPDSINRPAVTGRHPKLSLCFTFQTGEDCDLLTRLVVRLERPLLPDNLLQAELISSPLDSRSLGEWTGPSRGANSIEVKLPKPLRDFSIGRGATDFIVRLSTSNDTAAEMRKLVGLDIYGVRVNVSDYIILNRDRKCFAAVQRSFLKKLQSRNDSRWLTYLKGITNVRSD
jgi:hypothetical protein